MLRCPECRSRRTTYAAMQRHIEQSGHRLCTCGGYHYAHRPGSPFCFENPRAGLLHACRAEDLTDEQIMDILIDIIWDSPARPVKPGSPCPF